MSQVELPAVLVVYDQGSLAPTRIAQAAQEAGCRPLFLVPGSEHASQLLPVLENFGTVIDGRGFSTREQLVRELRAREPVGITTFAERQLLFTAEIAAALGLPYQDVADIPAITTKAAQRERLRSRGVDELSSVAVTDLAQAEQALREIGLPAIVKPNLSNSSRNTFRVESAEEYRSSVARLLSAPGGDPDHEDCLVIEPVLIGRKTPEPWGDYVGVDSLVQHGVVHPLFVTGKFSSAPPFRERGGYCPPVLPAEEIEAVKELAARAVRAMNFQQGLVDVEMKLTEEGPRVIEINGRLGGWVDGLGVVSGAGSPAVMAMAAAMGVPIALTPATGRPQRVTFGFLAGAPVWAKRVRALPGLPGLRAMGGVDRISLHVRPGSEVDWRKGTYGASLAAFFGVVDSHDRLAEIVQRIERLDWVEFDA